MYIDMYLNTLNFKLKKISLPKNTTNPCEKFLQQQTVYYTYCWRNDPPHDTKISRISRSQENWATFYIYTAPGKIMFTACYTWRYGVKSFIPPFMVRGQQN